MGQKVNIGGSNIVTVKSAKIFSNGAPLNIKFAKVFADGKIETIRYQSDTTIAISGKGDENGRYMENTYVTIDGVKYNGEYKIPIVKKIPIGTTITFHQDKKQILYNGVPQNSVEISLKIRSTTKVFLWTYFEQGGRIGRGTIDIRDESAPDPVVSVTGELSNRQYVVIGTQSYVSAPFSVSVPEGTKIAIHRDPPCSFTYNYGDAEPMVVDGVLSLVVDRNMAIDSYIKAFLTSGVIEIRDCYVPNT